MIQFWRACIGSIYLLRRATMDNFRLFATARYFTLCVGLLCLGWTFHIGCGPTTSSEATSSEATTDASLAEEPPKEAQAQATVELTKDLCNDPSKMAAVAEAMQKNAGSGTGFGGGDPTLAQRMMKEPTKGPFYMFNLIKFRAKAKYPDGRKTDLTGKEANALYSPVEFLSAIGARVVFTTDVTKDNQIDGKDYNWDQIAVVEYPCPLAFFAMTSHPDFLARAIHKTAGVEKTIVMVTELAPSQLPPGFTPPKSPYPPTKEDPSFELIHVQDFHETAQYKEGTNEPKRTGEEAWNKYASGGSAASQKVGSYPTALFKVMGVLTGDERSWDQIQIVRMPSRAGFKALLDDKTRQDGRYHREAALAHNYSIIAYPTLNDIPGSVKSGGTQTLPIASDGTGTLCTDDSSCSKLKAKKCLKQGSAGFCTVEGCKKGTCADGYLCCHDCKPELASFLPFKGSACLPSSATSGLTGQAGCTCD